MSNSDSPADRMHLLLSLVLNALADPFAAIDPRVIFSADANLGKASKQLGDWFAVFDDVAGAVAGVVVGGVERDAEVVVDGRGKVTRSDWTFGRVAAVRF